MSVGLGCNWSPSLLVGEMNYVSAGIKDVVVDCRDVSRMLTPAHCLAKPLPASNHLS